MKRIKRLSLLTVIWLGFIFLLFQGAGYIYFDLLNTKQVGQYGYPHGLFVPHDQLDYYYAPNFEGSFSGSAYQSIPIQINGHGFRDDEFTTKNDKRRLLMLGDSVVFGAGVRKEERLTESLEKQLNESDVAVELLNLGVNSYSFEHYLTLAQMNFLELEPDFVLMGFTLNDLARKEQAWPAYRYGRLKSDKYPSKPDLLRSIQSFFSRTYAGRFSSEVQARLAFFGVSDEEKKQYTTKWMRSVDKHWHDEREKTRLFSSMQKFDRIMKDRDTDYLVVIFPELNTLLYADEFHYPRHALRDFLDRQSMEYCDLYSIFASYPGELQELFLAGDSVHFTPAGHELASLQIQQCLQKNQNNV